MKIALAQLDYHVGNFEENTLKIIQNIQAAKEQGTDIIAFAELAVCGYPPWDFLEFDDFIDRCEDAIMEIASHCHGIAAIVGSPSRNPALEGKNLHNSAWVLWDGKVQQIVSKTLLPTYDVFDEYRYFEPNSKFSCVEYKGYKIALTVCEDLWNQNDDPMYIINPMDKLIEENPDFAINIAASPFSFRHDSSRTKVLCRNAAKYNIPFFYVNHVGAQTELIFDGASMVVRPDGTLYKFPVFEEKLETFDLEKIKNEPLSLFTENPKYELVSMALTEGIRDYFQKMGFSKAILGLSGGIDSAVVFALAVNALGKDNVLPVLLPSRYTSGMSNSDAIEMAEKLGTSHKIIHIEKVMLAYEETLATDFAGLSPGLAEENIQARTRGAY